MKVIALTVIPVAIFPHSSSNGQRSLTNETSGSYATIPTVEFCELLRNPQVYDQKIVRTRAIYRFGAEDLSIIYCPACVSDWMRPNFADTGCTKPGIEAKISVQRHRSGTVRVVMVGQFIGRLSQLVIQCVERADYITNDSHPLDALPPKIQKRVRCD